MTMMTPTIQLDFTSAVLDPKITFTRSLNTATRINSSGVIESVNADIARFDFNPVTLACRGLLIEETRQNVALYSSEFANAWWVKTEMSVATATVTAPDGVATVEKFEVTNEASIHIVQSTLVASSSGTVHSFSVFVKAAEYDFAFIGITDGATGQAQRRLNLTTGVVDAVNVGGAGSWTNTSAFAEPLKNGWWRFVLTSTQGAGTAVGMQIIVGDNTGAQLFTGTTGNGIYVWGAQREIGAFATSYIPTTTATVTRNADVAAITGTNFSDWWQSSKGGVLVRARPGTVSGTRPWVQFDDGTANEIIALRGNTTNPELYIVDGGVAQAQIDAGTIAANTDYSLTGWWSTNDCKARLDSGAVVTDTSATIPTVTQARIGSDGTNYLNGTIASLNYYGSFTGQIYTRRKNKVIFSLM